jgi:hypothetical protein
MVKTTIQYEHILRAIGQGLEALSVETFDLQVANDTFLIQGAATQKESEKPNAAKLSAFKNAFLEICHISKKSATSETPAGKAGASSRAASAIYTKRHRQTRTRRTGTTIRLECQSTGA